MREEFIVNMLVLNAFTFDKQQDNQSKENFKMWICKLQELKGLATIEEACHYFISLGEQSEEFVA